MNAFYRTGHCRPHYVRQCRWCTGRASSRPSLEARLVALLDALPDEDRFFELRADLLSVKLSATPENDAGSRRRTAALIRFHVAAREGNLCGFLHQIADELAGEGEVRHVA